MARVKTNRTERITLMLAPDTIEYLTEIAKAKSINSVSLVTDQIIKEHQSFFSETVEQSKQSTEEKTTDLQTA